MRRTTPVRNLVIALLAAGAVLLASGFQLAPSALSGAQAAPRPARPQQAGFTLTPASSTYTIAQGGIVVTNNFLLDNNDLVVAKNIRITIPEIDGGAVRGITYTVFPSNPVNVPRNSQVSFAIRFNAASNAALGTFGLTLLATEVTTNEQQAASIILTVTPPPTATPTQTTPTATSGPSPTPLPICNNGAESNDPGNSQGSARQLLVNTEESHGICRAGDVDWFKFGAIGGKVYTIDIVRMDYGLDLQVILFDKDGNVLASSDDFFNRRPTPVPGTAPAAPAPGDTTAVPAFDVRPRIQSWRAPADGTYFILVRDITGLGGNDRQYTIVVRTESYGPTPILVPEVCLDQFEQDGLPETARLITANETHRDKRLCPSGDADWVKFFGKQGKTYYMYTDTRPYPALNPDGSVAGPEAGADTTMFLFDRDGRTILAANDDLAAGDSLDSEIRFTPPVDGFYYVQVKNSGDIGNQFIRYDFVLKLCAPAQETCGRSPVAQPAPPAGQPPAQATSIPTFAAPLTPTPTSTIPGSDSSQDVIFAAGLAPGDVYNGATNAFVDPAFRAVWQRTDRPVAEQRAVRSWMWGPRGLMARGEQYAQAPGGTRQVQYFDKARMELTNPSGDRSSPWFVTTGLLVVEMITGRMQVGDQEFVQREPADIPVAGDPDDPAAPRYSSFGGVTGQLADDRTGQMVTETLDRAGRVGRYAGPPHAAARLAHYVPESRHNIAQAFWDYLNARGTVYENGAYRSGPISDWVFTMGYPISEPFWTRVRVGGVERDVLVQVFERRVLTYSPDNPAGWRVEQGNVGRHYYAWRYGEQLPN